MSLPQDVSFEPLLSLPPYALLAPDYALAGKRTLTLDALADQPLMLLDLPLSRECFLSLFESAGLRTVIVERTAHVAMMQAMVANGFGYGLMNVPSRNLDAPDGKPLPQVPSKGSQRPLELGLLTMRGESDDRTFMGVPALDDIGNLAADVAIFGAGCCTTYSRPRSMPRRIWRVPQGGQNLR